MKFTADIEILDSYSYDEIEYEYTRFLRALEQKVAWDRLSEDEKDRLFENSKADM